MTFRYVLNISKHVTFVAVTAILFINPVFSEETKNQQQPQPKKEAESLKKQLEHVDDTQSRIDDTYVPKGSVDRFEDLALTPYWDIEMGTNETVLVDCGVYTAGESNIKIHWIKTDGTIVNSTDDR